MNKRTWMLIVDKLCRVYASSRKHNCCLVNHQDLLSSFNHLDGKYCFVTVLWFQALYLWLFSSEQTCLLVSVAARSSASHWAQRHVLAHKHMLQSCSETRPRFGERAECTLGGRHLPPSCPPHSFTYFPSPPFFGNLFLHFVCSLFLSNEPDTQQV